MTRTIKGKPVLPVPRKKLDLEAHLADEHGIALPHHQAGVFDMLAGAHVAQHGGGVAAHHHAGTNYCPGCRGRGDHSCGPPCRACDEPDGPDKAHRCGLRRLQDMLSLGGRS